MVSGRTATSSVRKSSNAKILKGGRITKMFGYAGIVPGPTIKATRGRRIRLRVRNHLPPRHPAIGHETSTSTHLHGSASKPQYDGYASDVTPAGFYKDYRYPNFQPARTLWYHDHGAHHTAQNVFSGLVGQYHLTDKVDRALLPQGEFDVPLTVSDVAFREDGQLLFDDEGHSGTFGDVVLVNGRPWPVMKVKRRVYRFRILAASVSRSWRWRLGSGLPDDDRGNRRRTDAEVADRHRVPARQRRAVRGAHRLLEVPSRKPHRAEQPEQRQQS